MRTEHMQTQRQSLNVTVHALAFTRAARRQAAPAHPTSRRTVLRRGAMQPLRRLPASAVTACAAASMRVITRSITTGIVDVVIVIILILIIIIADAR